MIDTNQCRKSGLQWLPPRSAVYGVVPCWVILNFLLSMLLSKKYLTKSQHEFAWLPPATLYWWGCSLIKTSLSISLSPQRPSTMASTDRDALLALLALYRWTDGPNWRNSANWCTDADLSDWHGVEVNRGGRVVKLFLEQNLRGVYAYVRQTVPCGLFVLPTYPCHEIARFGGSHNVVILMRGHSDGWSHSARSLVFVYVFTAYQHAVRTLLPYSSDVGRHVDSLPLACSWHMDGPPVSHMMSIPDFQMLLGTHFARLACTSSRALSFLRIRSRPRGVFGKISLGAFRTTNRPGRLGG